VRNGQHAACPYSCLHVRQEHTLPSTCTERHDHIVCLGAFLQEGKELDAKARAEAAVKNDSIKAQLARQLAERAQREQQEKQEELDYAQVEQVRRRPGSVLGSVPVSGCSLYLEAGGAFLPLVTHSSRQKPHWFVMCRSCSCADR